MAPLRRPNRSFICLSPGFESRVAQKLPLKPLLTAPVNTPTYAAAPDPAYSAFSHPPGPLFVPNQEADPACLDPAHEFDEQGPPVAAFREVPRAAVPGGHVRSFSDAGVLPGDPGVAHRREAHGRLQRVPAPDPATGRAPHGPSA